MVHQNVKITSIQIEVTNEDTGDVAVMRRGKEYAVVIDGAVFPRHIELFNAVLKLARECDQA